MTAPLARPTPRSTPTHSSSRWAPAWWPLVDRHSLRADALAGLLGTLLVLPQGIAFATLAGLPPEYGLYASVVPVIVAALAGSSRHVVTGPTNTNSLALFAALSPLAVAGSPQYIEIALAVTVMVGLIELATGLLRLGAVANFISPPALHGFTAGAAVLIAFHALHDALAVPLPSARSAASWLAFFTTGLPHAHAGAVLVAGVTLGCATALRAWKPRWPFMLIALAAGTATAAAWNGMSPGHAVRVVGALGSAVPVFHVPDVPVEQLPELLGIAAALTVVALAQSISIAKAIGERSGQRIDGNREFVGQGLANVLGGFFSCWVACGSLNRSVPNLEAGARTPLAAAFSGLLVIPLVAASGSALALIPYAAISGLLILIARPLFDLPRWRHLWRANRTEFGVALLTLLATLALPMEIAVLVGSASSLGLFLQRTSRPAMRTMGIDAADPQRRFVVIDDAQQPAPECPQLKLLRMEGGVYFGATAYVSDRLQALRDQASPQKHLLVMAKSMNFVDVAGSDLWRHELAARRAMGGDLHFHRPRPPVVEQWRQDGFLDALGADHLHPDKRHAIAAIIATLDPTVCATCKARVFTECSGLPGAAPQPAPDKASPLY